MAVIFEIHVCVGTEEADANRLAESFRTLPAIDPKFVRVHDIARRWWLTLVPKGLSYGSPSSPFIEPDEERVAAIEAVYAHLHDCEPFIFACAGFELEAHWDDDLEPDELITLDGIVVPALYLSRAGAVIPESWRAEIESAERFQPFRPGQLWDPDLASLVT